MFYFQFLDWKLNWFQLLDILSGYITVFSLCFVFLHEILNFKNMFYWKIFSVYIYSSSFKHHCKERSFRNVFANTKLHKSSTLYLGALYFKYSTYFEYFRLLVNRRFFSIYFTKYLLEYIPLINYIQPENFVEKDFMKQVRT